MIPVKLRLVHGELLAFQTMVFSGLVISSWATDLICKVTSIHELVNPWFLGYIHNPKDPKNPQTLSLIDSRTIATVIHIFHGQPVRFKCH